MVASKQSSHRGSETTPRHAWLAALGLFAVARREAKMAVEIAFDEAARLRNQLGGFGDDARAVARGGVLTLREQAAPVIARVGAEIETRLAPLLDPIMQKLGLAPLAGKRANRNAKPRKAARTASARRAAPAKARKRTTVRAKG